ncbi:hypothetical protein [Streptomyces sp. NPDC050388]|uniref:hypothetical protein n=1 Tax=Streptomyces sp. NPDC050388 TaxID=3155781 RepID=UPI003425843F
MSPRYLDFSKPLPVHDEETGEYLGYWMGPDGEKVKEPSRFFPPKPTGGLDENHFLDLMEWRQRRSAEGALGRLQVFANRVRHGMPIWRLKQR